jgi:hypothetical protein
MKLLINQTDYTETIQVAENLDGEFNRSVVFHCYWNGALNEKHLYSILSCYYFNVYKNKHKIILWLENNTPNNYNAEIKKYAEIRFFSFIDEKNNTFFLNNYNYNMKENAITYYSDFVRSLLLYNYGGVWFDLDCFILRNFDPIFYNFGDEICVYQWANQNYPNNAIYISLKLKSEIMKKNIEFIVKRNRGWGFQQANLTYELPLDMLILPCSWFDAIWITNPYNIGHHNFFKNTDKQYNFDNFFKGSFCYHWHNRWDHNIEDNSIIMQLVKIIHNNMDICM